MNRALVLVLSLGIVASACRQPTNDEKGKIEAKAPVERTAVVRPISPSAGSRIAIANIDGARSAIVSDEDDHAIVVVDIDKRAITSRTSFSATMGQLLVAPNGTIYAAVRGAAKVVALRVCDDGALIERASVETGHEPWGLALSPDGSDLFVTSIGDARLESFSAADLAPRMKVDVPRDPRSVITTDGKRLFVSHAVGSVMSIVDVSEGRLLGASHPVSLAADERRSEFGKNMFPKLADTNEFGERLGKTPPERMARFTMTRFATQGFALAAMHGKVLLPETLVLPGDETAISIGYGNLTQSTLSTHVPFVARVDATSGELETKAFSGPRDRKCFERKPECILPRAVATTDTELFVACADDGVIVVDTTEDDYVREPRCTSALDARKRIDIESPNGVAVDSATSTLVAFSDLTRRISITSTKRSSEVRVVELPRHEAAPSALAIEGRRLFHKSGDERISRNGRACASCHPEGRDDALVWSTPKGKRQTPMLAGRVVGTAPYDWNGAHANLEVHIISTVKNLEGKGLPDEALSALAAYLTSLEPPVRRPKKSDAVAHGAALFRSSETGCASCHIETMRLTDGVTHPIEKEHFDTPSLAFVGMTAPYFHDGRYGSLEELVDKCDGVMGHTQHLSQEERKDLVAFLRSL